ncbi:MAG: hypothetical protein HN509_10115 [Halobacteriovoraceae bacterium]|nr:hypothetical protein [Halobacteriovoraceae bacterium]MBT5095122.1 hypothetical protein [Halobacteriovoraceae bacterium]
MKENSLKNYFNAERQQLREAPKAFSQSFSEALLGPVPWGTKSLGASCKPLGPAASEKRQTLVALNQYVEKRKEMTPEVGEKKPVFKIPGGEIHVLDDQISQAKSWKISAVAPKNCPHCLREEQNGQILSPELLEAPLKILLLGEACHGGPEGEPQLIINKMISAMGLSAASAGQGILVRCQASDSEVPSHKSCPCFELSLHQILKWKPQFVISMGAISSALLLGKRERISKVHGKFCSRQVTSENGEGHSFQLVPLFHPNYLAINPNMKRSAWNDLQKIMQALS